MTTIRELLAPVKTRAEEVGTYRPQPWRKVVNTAGDRHGVVDSSGCVVTMDAPGSAEFFAKAPRDIARLVAAIEAVAKVHDSTDAIMNPGRHERLVKVCVGCGTDDGNWSLWPCATVRAMVAALGGEA